MTEQFDRAYYQRFYVDPRTAVTNRAEMNARGRLIAAMADHLGLAVRSILDAGCGVGLLRAPLKRGLPRASYTGLEVSEYLCRRHGWIHGGIQDFTRKVQYDLVICYDVLQYLDAAQNPVLRLTANLNLLRALTEAGWQDDIVGRLREIGAATSTLETSASKVSILLAVADLYGSSEAMTTRCRCRLR